MHVNTKFILIVTCTINVYVATFYRKEMKLLLDLLRLYCKSFVINDFSRQEFTEIGSVSLRISRCIKYLCDKTLISLHNTSTNVTFAINVVCLKRVIE